MYSKKKEERTKKKEKRKKKLLAHNSYCAVNYSVKTLGEDFLHLKNSALNGDFFGIFHSR